MSEASTWISWAEAAQLTGIPVHVIEWWKRQGRIEHRPEDKRRPTLRRSSVEEFDRWYHARETERAQRQEQRLAGPKRSSRGAEATRTDWLRDHERSGGLNWRY